MLERFRNARVLVIDDNLANIQLLVSLLERAGLRQISTATDAETGLRLAGEIQPDVILLDLHMPKMNGYAVLEALTASSTETNYLPVLVLTADTTKDAVNRALLLGARDFLTKPFDATEVVLRVRNLLETRYLYSTLREHNIALTDELERRLEREQLAEREKAERLERIEHVLAERASMGMVFQSIVDVADRSVVGVEALARFADEPLRSPDLWFGEAAEVGLGTELEMKAVRAAIAELDRLPAGVFLAVNVSPALVMSGKLDYLAADPVCPRLVFELTEHVAVDDYGPIRQHIDPLREHGARVAVDDAGAGFSSMRHILLLQPEIIKLDNSLTHGVDHDPARRALASSLISFAKDIGASLIAEGVETAEELSTLEGLGAHWVQGYHIARPAALPA
jgi:EAL domain-containing protein (putative c-di-GMP-specific phosphodiesterase class I)